MPLPAGCCRLSRSKLSHLRLNDAYPGTTDGVLFHKKESSVQLSTVCARFNGASKLDGVSVSGEMT